MPLVTVVTVVGLFRRSQEHDATVQVQRASRVVFPTRRPLIALVPQLPAGEELTIGTHGPHGTPFPGSDQGDQHSDL